MIYFVFAAALLLAGCTAGQETVLEPRSEADLSGLTIATSNGSYYHEKYSHREDVNLFVANTEADAVQAVRQGMADLYVSDEVMLTREEQTRLGMKMFFRGEESFHSAYALKKGNQELLDQLNRFLATAPVAEIVSHWTAGLPEVEEPACEIPDGAAPLRCITATNMSPVGYLGDAGEWYGIDPDILRRFAHSIGRPFEMRFQDLGSAIIALQTGQADIVSAFLFITEERQKAVAFSVPYYETHPGYFGLDRANRERQGFMDRVKANFLTDNRWKLITDGLLETLKITILAILLGTLLGAGVCAMLRSRRKWVRKAVGLYGSFIQGIPTLVLLLIMFYVILANAGMSGSLVAILTFALCFAWSAGSIFDTSISSVPKGQTEAGLSLGFTPLETFLGIVLPQAVQKGLPLFAGECVSLLKSTSIVGYIAIQDLTRASDLIRSRTFDALLPLLVVTVLYFVLAWLIRLLLNLFLKK